MSDSHEVSSTCGQVTHIISIGTTLPSRAASAFLWRRRALPPPLWRAPMRCAGGHPCGVGIRVACPATPCGPAGWARWALDRGPRVSPATPPRPPPRASRPDLQSARGLLTRTVSLPTGGDSSIHSTRRPDSEAGLMVSRPPRIQPRNLRTARAEPRGRALPTCSVEDARVGGFALQRTGWLLLGWFVHDTVPLAVSLCVTDRPGTIPGSN